MPELWSRIQRPCKGKRGPEKQANRHEERFIRPKEGAGRQGKPKKERSDKGAQMKKPKIKGLKPHHLNGQLVIQTGHKDDVIFQELHSQQGNKIERIVQWISDTRDKKLKDMLIEMGWTPPTAGVSLKQFTAEADKGPCWITHKGCVTQAYFDDSGLFRFNKYNHNVYPRECITAVQAIKMPQAPDNKKGGPSAI